MALFKIDEFINMAIKDEETGIAFYRTLAETTKNEVLKANYNRIADQEVKHAENFRNMLGKVEKTEHFEEYAGQYENYMTTLLESRAFTTPEKAAAAAKEMSALEAINTAMRMEKDTLLFYLDIKELVPATNKEYIEEIIREERGHLSELSNLKDQLAKP